MFTETQLKNVPPQRQRRTFLLKYIPFLLLFSTTSFCQTKNTDQQNLISIIPMFFFILMIIAVVRWFKRRKKNVDLITQKEKNPSFSRILFGCFLIIAGIAMSGSLQNFYHRDLASFFSTMFASLIVVTGGIRVLSKSKPTIDPDGTVYADFGKRFTANTIDAIIFIILFYTMHFVFDRLNLTTYIIATSVFTLAAHLFVVWMISKYHATPGKMIMGLVVKTIDKKDITTQHALLRSSVDIGFAILYSIAFLISLKTFSYSEFRNLPMLKGMAYATSRYPIWHIYVTALSNFWFWSELAVLMFNKKRRAIHDYIANTVVIEKPKC